MLVRSLPRARRSILTTAPLIACLSITPIAAAEECPATSVSCSGTDANGDPVFYVSDEFTGPSGSVSYGQSSASFDLVDGRLSAIAKIHEANAEVSRVVASDRFYLHNVAEATFTIRLDLSWEYVADQYRQAWAGAAARLSAEGQSAETETTLLPVLDDYIEIEITAYEGVPFVVTYEAEANGRGYYPWSLLAATLEFIGLPEGATITSCNGYGETSVSVEESTWGAVKSLYR
jgi:hypothetical protein